ncbi:hypothetical protein Q1J45_10365 [Pseudomonas rhodesiae]|jgi:hypothetical protein
MSDQDGGTAFPIVHPDGSGVQYFGMSLRDYFAAKALQGICASGPGADCNNDFIAREAYGLADAMLAARSA